MTPSPAEIRRRALLAAAKVTLSLSALACGDTEALPVRSADLAAGGAGTAGAASAGHGGATSAGASGASGHAGALAGGQAGGAGRPPAGAAGAPGDGLACGLPAAGPSTGAEVACCTDVVAAVLPPWTDFSQPEPERPASLDASTQACCGVLVKAINATQPFDFNSAAHQQAVACCPYLMPYATTGFMGPTCTPWGPPMPAAMPAHLLATLPEAWV